jgi:hypothetical protein
MVKSILRLHLIRKNIYSDIVSRGKQVTVSEGWIIVDAALPDEELVVTPMDGGGHVQYLKLS